MDDLIKALQIFRKYMTSDAYAPTHCEHDVFMVCCVPFDSVSAEDVIELDKLGFEWSNTYDCWTSSRFGSC